MKKHGITSLAAPTEADRKKLRALSKEDRIALICSEIEAGRVDIEAGRYTELATDEDIHNFFEASRAKYEIKAV